MIVKVPIRALNLIATKCPGDCLQNSLVTGKADVKQEANNKQSLSQNNGRASTLYNTTHTFRELTRRWFSKTRGDAAMKMSRAWTLNRSLNISNNFTKVPACCNFLTRTLNILVRPRTSSTAEKFLNKKKSSAHNTMPKMFFKKEK